MVWFSCLLMAGIYAGVGVFVKHYPELLSGYTTMSAERKERVDIRALGRYCTRLMYLLALLSCAGLVVRAFGAAKETAVAWTVFLPIPVLVAGWIWGWRKYDKKFLKK